MAEQAASIKKITLRDFKPDEFKVWEVSTKATLKLHKLLGIVDGSDPDPTPRNPDGTARAIPPALRARVTKWENDHERAREAIIRCQPNSELLKLVDVQDDAPAIWRRLRDEYGRSSNLDYVRASNDLTLLKMDDKMSINDHINRFEQLVYDVNYNKPTATPNLAVSVVNLKFLNTLMTDKTSSEKWETFINAKGPQLEQMSTQQLYAEVRVNAARIKPADKPADTSEAKALTTELQQAIQALTTRFSDSSQRANGNKSKGGKGQNQWQNQGQNQSQQGKHGGNRRRNQKHGNRRPRFPYEPDKYCKHHDIRGHSSEDCQMAKRQRRNQPANSNSTNFTSSYQPSFKKPRDFSVNTTRLIVNSTAAEAEHRDPHAWIVDSAANAYITPFKEMLYNYREFTNQVRVKGFAGKTDLARGTGTIMLTDHTGKGITLKDVVYVPESPDQILSLMKLRREQSADFWFTATETFKISFPYDVLFSGKSVNDILYIWTSSTPAICINAVVTRNASKRHISHDSRESNDDVDDYDEMPEPDSQASQQRHITPSAVPSIPNPLHCSPQDLWHLRFGHASSTILRKLRYIKSYFDSTHCITCIRAKQTRKPFYPSERKVTRKLERIHSDICGPYPTSKGKSVYVLTFLDEFTHWCWTVTIPDKSSATVCREYRYLIKQIETESDLKIKYLRTDGGGEYEGDLTPVLKDLGVKHEPTSPHSPQSNGKAERLNRTLNNYARAMLYQANMPKSFWAESITTAAYILNRLPSDAIDDAIPFELWHQKSLSIHDLKSIKPFGCMVEAHVSKTRRKKLSKMDMRSTTGCFIGYTDSNTMHKIWDFERKCFVNSHDLYFDETRFPEPSDFDEPPADAYSAYRRPNAPMPAQVPTPAHIHILPASTRDSTPEPLPEPQAAPVYEPQIFDEIVVQPPPALHAFKSYGEFEPDNDPPSFVDAMRRPDSNLWWEGFCDEIKSIIKRETWTLDVLPPGKKALPLRWVCRVKRDATNTFERYKARIVVKGFAQEAGFDFDETFAPVVRIDSVRTLFAISAGKGLYIIQADIKNAFLHSNSDFQIYIQQPEGFADANYPDAVLLLNKALYGLKQAPRLWYLLISEIVISLGFQVLESDTSVYIRDQIILAVYVDDILIAGPSIRSCNAVITELSQHIEVVNKGEVNSFLGFKVVRNRQMHSISISQPGYIDRLLAKFNMTNAKSASTPFEPGTKLRMATPDDKLCNLELYQELTGSLNHLAVFSRPDITFAVSKLSKYNANPTTTHFKAALHVLRYLKGTRNYCIIYYRSTTVPIIDILGFSDSDFASDEDDRKSYTGYIFLICGGAVSWSTHKQSTVALSSMEAEYMALSDAAREALARKQLFCELQIPSGLKPITILSDSQSALDISENPARYRQAKHIDVRYHAIRHYIHDLKIEVDYSPSEHQPADLFTKALGPTKHQRFCHLIGLRNSYDI